MSSYSCWQALALLKACLWMHHSATAATGLSWAVVDLGRASAWEGWAMTGFGIEKPGLLLRNLVHGTIIGICGKQYGLGVMVS